MRVFVDNDVVLDVILGREKYVDSRKMFGLIEGGLIDGYTSSIVMVNSLYVARKHIGKMLATKRLRMMRKLLKVVDTGQSEVDQALTTSLSDFEDAIQYYSAKRAKLKTLVTRNVNDYPKSGGIVVLSPTQILKLNSN